MKQYARAPITDAILDIRVRTVDEVDIAKIEQLHDGEVRRYPQKAPIILASVTVDPAQAPTEMSQNQRGWAFATEDRRQVWQVSPDGFTFSRHGPYENWQGFRNEARKLWESARNVLGVEALTRVAVRYVNRLELPLPLVDFKDYFRTVPEVSPTLPQGLVNFFMQLQIPLEDLKAMLIINQTILPPRYLSPTPTSVGVLLDIDIFRVDNLPIEEDVLWSYFEQLHERKNEVFEGCITDRTRELIS